MKIKPAHFVLIQASTDHKYYEIARVRPYWDDKKDGWDSVRGYYCEGFAQKNGELYEFSLHLGPDGSESRHKYINLGYPAKYNGEDYNGEPIEVR